MNKPLVQQRPMQRIWKTPSSKWKWLFLLLALIIIGILIMLYRSAIATEQDAGPGDDPFRLMGITAYILVLIVTAYTLRRRFVRSLPGKVQNWLWLHIWLGIISVIIASMHDMFQSVTYDLEFTMERFTEFCVWHNRPLCPLSTGHQRYRRTLTRYVAITRHRYRGAYQ